MTYPQLQLFINGEWRGGSGRETLPVRNPSTGSEIGRLPVATEVDVAEAISSTQAAFASWRARPAIERAALLHKAAGLLRAQAAEVGAIIATELGNPLPSATFEAHVASDVLDWSAGEARRVYGRVIPSRLPGTRQLALKVPVGPVFAASPWNMPLIFPARKIAEALAAGCTVIIKPAEETPGAAVALVRILEQAGLPPGVVNLLFGVPDMVSRTLIGSGVIRKVSFTGSVPVGKHLTRLAADQMVKCTMELGGHAPTIVGRASAPRSTEGHCRSCGDTSAMEQHEPG